MQDGEVLLSSVLWRFRDLRKACWFDGDLLLLLRLFESWENDLGDTESNCRIMETETVSDELNRYLRRVPTFWVAIVTDDFSKVSNTTNSTTLLDELVFEGEKILLELIWTISHCLALSSCLMNWSSLSNWDQLSVYEGLGSLPQHTTKYDCDPLRLSVRDRAFWEVPDWRAHLCQCLRYLKQ